MKIHTTIDGTGRLSSEAWFWINFVGVLLVAAALRVAGLTWGMPFVYHPDEPVNLVVVQNMLREGTANPHQFFYPSLFFYIHVPGQLFLEALSGDLRRVAMQSMGNGYTTQPEAFVIARIITACFGIGIVAGSMVLARHVEASVPAVILVGVFAAFDPLLTEHSRYMSPDVPAAFFCTLALIGAVRVLKGDLKSGYIFGGIMTGLAASSKYTAGLVGLSIAAAHFQYSRFTLNELGLLVLSGLLSAATFLLTSPFVILDFPHAMQGFLETIGIYWTGHPGAQGEAWKFNLLWIWGIFGPACLLVFLAVFHSAKAKLMPLAFFAAAYFIMVSFQSARFERNLVPLIPALIVLIGLGFEAFVLFVQRKVRWCRSSLLLVLLACAFVAPGAGVAISFIVSRYSDERADARIWISQHIAPGTSILVDSYSPYIDTKLFKVEGTNFVLWRPVSDVASHDVVVVSKIGSGRFLADGQSVERKRFDEITTAACERKEFKDHAGKPAFWLFRLHC